MIHVLPIDHRALHIAQQIHAISALAYAQEAALMQAERVADFDETVEEIQSGNDFCLGALDDDALVGFLSIGPDEEPNQISISTLVVHPQYQRRGVGQLLLADALKRSRGMIVSVCTGASNLPALGLYRKFGFNEYRRGTIGPEYLALVKLRNSAP